MQQIALDIGLSAGPTVANFFAGPNEAALKHLELWIGAKSSAQARSPVPTIAYRRLDCAATSMADATPNSELPATTPPVVVTNSRRVTSLSLATSCPFAGSF